MKRKTIPACMILLAMCLQLFACGGGGNAPTVTTSSTTDLMQNIRPVAVQTQRIESSYTLCAADFALELLRNAFDGGNCILSPYSVYASLAMCANGADTQTLAQIKNVLGLSDAELNVYLYALAQNTGEALKSANSVWFRQIEGFTVNEEFLQLNADYYGAEMFSSAFDEQTLMDINDWISENTAGDIGKALDQIDSNAMMYLINALTFDAQWQTIYHSGQITDGIFYAHSGEQTVQMMSSNEQKYLDDGNATGFIKDYEGEQYSYFALLPNEGISVEQYLYGLSGEDLLKIVQNPEKTTVLATMPKYRISCRTDLADALSAMGMEDAFSDEADFSRMSNAELFISRVLHQTQVTVDELGTQAGAVTISEMVYKGIHLNSKTVVLDRPFVMGIYDNVNQCIVFLGVIESVL